MIVTLKDNLTACSVEVDKKFYPAINDGVETYYFNAYIYSGEANAVEHARNTIRSIQTEIDTHLSNWRMNVKAK